jgi:hypothetical protein
MSNAMFYVWLLLGSFGFMTVLFFIAESENKKLRREKEAGEENQRFIEVYNQMQREAEALQRNMDESIKNCNDTISALYQRVRSLEDKIDTYMKNKK